MFWSTVCGVAAVQLCRMYMMDVNMVYKTFHHFFF